jgi:hypothetical protein
VHAPMQIGLSKNCNRSYLAAFKDRYAGDQIYP